MPTCNQCLLNDSYPGIKFNENNICSFCSEKKVFTPWGEEKLLAILNKVRQKNLTYDAMVPISGGKDSAYILHLAVNVYKLKVLAMTYDNGFLSELALSNIKKILESTGVKHFFYKPDLTLQKKIFGIMLKKSGDICGACDIATKASILKVARENKIPMILYGTSPLEEDSFVPDSIQDISRFKYIIKESNDISKKDINQFLIYPGLNYFKISFYKKTGIFPMEVSPLFYLPTISDEEMGNIISKTFGWEKDTSREYSKHFDCIAEPFTNYVRNKIYGYERRRCQYSNMIRRSEISREKAIDLLNKDQIEEKPVNYSKILSELNVSKSEMESVLKIQPLKYEKHTSKANKAFAKIMKVIKR